MADILLIDRNEAFATMLKEMLETDGVHTVRVAARGSKALALLAQDRYDLTIVDMDQDSADASYAQLIAEVRQLQPRMRIVLIPLMGEQVPVEADELDIQGTLSKPFFVDDLLPSIKDALSREVQSRATAATPRPALVTSPPAGAEGILSDLVRETQAEIVVLLSTAGGRSQVLAHNSNLRAANLETLAGLSLAALDAAQAVASFLGKGDRAYEHNMFENKDSRLYVMVLPDDLALLVVTSMHTPLGTIRHNLRRASRQLARRDVRYK
jgi:CheY-like chemotaxis protein/predicted regulator of Ras-like GTPase activity (Roadblock/LC7/MglB family)